MQKILINRSYGGFKLSEVALIEYLDKKNIKFECFEYQYDYRTQDMIYKWCSRESVLHGDVGDVAIFDSKDLDTVRWGKDNEYSFPENFTDYSNLAYEIDRDDPVMISVVEKLGKKANAVFPPAHIVVIEIPDDVEWIIEGYDGLEWVAEKHRHWPERRTHF